MNFKNIINRLQCTLRILLASRSAMLAEKEVVVLLQSTLVDVWLAYRHPIKHVCAFGWSQIIEMINLDILEKLYLLEKSGSWMGLTENFGLILAFFYQDYWNDAVQTCFTLWWCAALSSGDKKLTHIITYAYFRPSCNLSYFLIAVKVFKSHVCTIRRCTLTQICENEASFGARDVQKSNGNTSHSQLSALYNLWWMFLGF